MSLKTMDSLVIYRLRQRAVGEKILSCFSEIVAELLEATWAHLGNEIFVLSWMGKSCYIIRSLQSIFTRE